MPTTPTMQACRSLSRVWKLGTYHCRAGRSFATSPRCDEAVVAAPAVASAAVEPSAPSSPPPLDPRLVYSRADERRLLQSGVQPIGSRRRRAALLGSANIPFEQLPYQCFQEARKILQADRETKLKQIETERRRIAAAVAMDPAQCGGEAGKKGKLIAMRQHLEKLKVYADINDPMIKKRFEDGEGDMSRPVYRYLADKKWRSYQRKIVMQRITQMHVVPDVISHMDPIANVSLHFGRHNIASGAMVNSLISERTPRLRVQLFDSLARLVTIAVVDSDVPNVLTDGFDYRCHYLAVNIPLSATTPTIYLPTLPTDAHVILPWLPPHAQKGSPYHRLSVFVLEQPDARQLDVAEMRQREQRADFRLASLIARRKLRAIGVELFRTVFDHGTVDVMRRAGIEGAEVELIRKKPESLPLKYKVKDGARYR